MNKLILSVVCILSLSCANLTPQQSQALLVTSSNLARIAVSAAATFFGGAQAGQLASAGLDGLASVLQAYVGGKIPAGIVAASPGIDGVGAAIVTTISPDHVVSQKDVDAVAKAARIAELFKNAIVVPTATPAK